MLQQTKPLVGGQAVLEGVMMRSPKSFVVVVRRPDKQIVVRQQKWETLLSSIKPLRWPLMRGAVVLIESLWNGLSALSFSAEQAMPQDENRASEPQAQTATGTTVLHDAPVTNQALPQVTSKQKAALATTMVVSLALGMGLFVGVPHLLTWLIGVAFGVSLKTNGLAFHVIDGSIKAAIFLGYLTAISRLPDIKRVFEYHGAEHKAIWAYENSEPLNVENVARYTTLHPRCGTSFILIVLVMSIFLFAAVFPFIPRVSEHALLNHLAMIGIKLPLMLPLAGISYELQRFSARKGAPRFLQLMVKPGLWMQKITTREPSKEQLEISILALSRALAREQGRESQDGVKIFRDFQEAMAAQ